ncbi:Retrotransposable element Tf2 [Gossypium australe]|uniref:Retrotransposable element Tf2 n=1 Tax=Gossypium australe TaxID=47621 RepID=A0A5B6W870_9ROSI|nr:Retrotransposable element Tf2 [Gossypium australe]
MIVDRLIKLAHFVVVRRNYSLEKMAELYTGKIVCLYGILSSIVSSRDLRFTSRTNWEKYLPLVEFAYNNNYHPSLGMSPFEVLYGRKCRSPICWLELNENKLVGPDLVCEAEKKVLIIKNHLKMAQDH